MHRTPNSHKNPVRSISKNKEIAVKNYSNLKVPTDVYNKPRSRSPIKNRSKNPKD